MDGLVGEFDEDYLLRLFVGAFKFPLLHGLDRALLEYRAAAEQCCGRNRAARSNDYLQLYLADQVQSLSHRGKVGGGPGDYPPRFLGEKKMCGETGKAED